MRIGFDACPAWNAFTNNNHRAPLRKTGTHLIIFTEAIAQSVKAFRYFLPGMASHILCSGVNLDARDNSGIDEYLNHWSTVLSFLTDGLVEEYRAADGLSKSLGSN